MATKLPMRLDKLFMRDIVISIISYYDNIIPSGFPASQNQGVNI